MNIPRIRHFVTATAALAAFVLAPPARADVKLPSILGAHMVLQRDQAVPIWGWADAGEEVTVEFAGQKQSTKAGADGRWQVRLQALKASAESRTLTVKGKNTVALDDVLVGEVWLCSGQSNMEWTVSSSDKAQEEIAAANRPLIRHIKIPHRPSDKAEDNVPSEGWRICTPQTVGAFTAVGYFFGRTIQNELNVPVGLIGSNWGGTRIEPWIPPVGFTSVPALKDIAGKLDTFPSKTPAMVAETQPALDGDGKPILDKAGKPTTKLVLDASGKQKMRPLLDKDGKQVININFQTPLALYNGMIHPLAPYAMRGALWYQGESNNGEGMLYYEKMKALIEGWRTVWKAPAMPFYFVQLAPYTYGGDPTKLAGIWEAQTASLAIPHTGMAVTTDIANIKDIHPKNKQEVGRRLALWALAKTYNAHAGPFSGPIYKSMKAEGSKLRLSFDHAGGGLASRDGKPLSHFAVAGEDQKFVEADAQIEGRNVVVSAADVTKPVAVRFGWHQQAEPNFANKEGLPASPFRTDKWDAPAPAPAPKAK